MQTENADLLPTGSVLDSNISVSRKASLFRRKEDVIDALNQAYDNEESKRIEDTVSSNNSSNEFSIPNEDEVNLKSIDGSIIVNTDKKENKKKSISTNFAYEINNICKN